MKCWSANIQIKPIEQYLPVVLFIVLFEFVDEILKCDYVNESYCTVLACGPVYNSVGGSNLWISGWKCDHLLFIML